MDRRPSPRNTRQEQPVARSAFTPQQVLILILVAILGIAALTTAVILLFSTAPVAVQVNPTPEEISQPVVTSARSTPSPATPDAVLPAGCVQAAYRASQPAPARVIDGNTVELQTESGPLRVVFAGIEAAREGTLAEKAAALLHEMVDGQAVTLVQGAVDRNPAGEAPRYVFANGVFLNLELVQQGLAQINPSDPDQACAAAFQMAEQQAHAGRLGLWNPTPAPTHTFIPFVTLDPTLQAPCDCAARPVCSDFRTHAAAQACFNACQDYNSRLDANHDGIACPELP